MNQTQFQSFWKQLKEPLKQQWGKITDQDLTGIEGNVSRFSTMVEARYPQQRDEVLLWANRRHAHWSGWYEEYEDRKSNR